ncbi:MAG: hypothetical protein GX030_03545 [Firmicutes bacterium]|nr:hypothetical protein [Bacillota bacterium]
MDTLTHQVTAFMITILSGFVFGILYDLYRVIRGGIRPRHHWATIMDVLFWVVMTPTMIVQFILANWMDLRFYVLLGVVLGLFLYFTVFSWLVINTVVTIGRLVGGLGALLISGTGRILMAPVALIRHLSWRWRWSRLPKSSNYRPRPGMRWRGGIAARLFWWQGR